jgi:GR25 family glycosyltransferase involved in LPS biosynthesis
MRTQHLWALNETEFEFDEQMIVFMNEDFKSEKIFTHSFLATKYLDLNKKAIYDIEFENKNDLAKYFELIYQYMSYKNLDDFFFLLFELKGEKYGKHANKFMATLLKIIESDREIKPIENFIFLESLGPDENKSLQYALISLVTSEDSQISTLAFEIISKHLKNMSVEDCLKLFSMPYIDTFLKIVERNTQQSSNRGEIVKNEILIILLTLIQISPKFIELFIEKGGMDLCLVILNVSH